MAVKRLDNILIVVEDLEAVTAFFVALGLEVVGETTVEGPWVDQTVGLRDVRADIVMLGVPGGGTRVELSRFQRPAAVAPEPRPAPSNTLGLRRIMFAIDDVDATVERLRGAGGALVGEIARYEDLYRLCFVRGPDDVVVGLAQEL
jgi:catechol 2,3-dioxygenase-like lactoylglutathione lyase family enzyme